MRKVFAILLILAMLFVTASCSNTNNESSLPQSEAFPDIDDVSDSTAESSKLQTEDNDLQTDSTSQDETESNAPDQAANGSSTGTNSNENPGQPTGSNSGTQNGSTGNAGNGNSGQSTGGNSGTQNGSTGTTGNGSSGQPTGSNSGTQNSSTGNAGGGNSEQPTDSGKILIAYFSRVGNTNWEDGVDAVTSASLNVENGTFVGNAQILARMAQQVTGGDLFLIQTVDTYPSDYRQTTDKANTEQANNARPALSSHVENMAQYDTIILIYPNWWGTLPQPLFTFLEEYDFSGKTILPLCTHEGSALGRSERDIKSICPNATLLTGLAVRGSSVNSAQSNVESWIKNSGILG